MRAQHIAEQKRVTAAKELGLRKPSKAEKYNKSTVEETISRHSIDGRSMADARRDSSSQRRRSFDDVRVQRRAVPLRDMGSGGQRSKFIRLEFWMWN